MMAAGASFWQPFPRPIVIFSRVFQLLLLLQSQRHSVFNLFELKVER